MFMVRPLSVSSSCGSQIPKFKKHSNYIQNVNKMIFQLTFHMEVFHSKPNPDPHFFLDIQKLLNFDLLFMLW